MGGLAGASVAALARLAGDLSRASAAGRRKPAWEDARRRFAILPAVPPELRRQVWPMIVVIAVLLPFLPALAGGEVLIARDHLNDFLGKRQSLAQGLHGERSLIWNPYRAAGTPFLADPQAGVLYPPAVAVFGLLGPGRLFGLAVTLYIALHGVLGGLGCWAWLRARGLGGGPAALGAMAFQLNGLMLSLVDPQNNWCTLAWLPLALLCTERALRGSGTRSSAGLAMVLALAFLAGEPQLAAMIALVAAGRLLFDRRTRRRPVRVIGGLALAAVLSAALSAVGAVPLLVHAKHTLRADGVPMSMIADGSMRPIEVFDLFSPSLFQAPQAPDLKLTGTQHWLATLYLGWVALALASWLARRRALRLAPWFLLGLAGLLLAMGPQIPGGRRLIELLHWDAFRYPVRLAVLMLPALALDLLSYPTGLFDSVKWSWLRELRAPAPLAGLVREEEPPPRAYADPALQLAMLRGEPNATPEQRVLEAFRRLAPGPMELVGVQEIGRDGIYPLRSYEPIVAALPAGRRELDAFLALDARLTDEGLVRREGGGLLRAIPVRAAAGPWQLHAAALAHPERLLTDGVPVDEALARAAPGRCASEAVVELLSWRAHDVRASVETPCAVVVLHLVSAAPGWRAELDGAPVPLGKALGAFQAVAVPAGAHELRFVHRPPGVRAAAGVSAAALLIVLLLAVRRPRSA